MEDFPTLFSYIYVNKHLMKHKSQTFNLQRQEQKP